MSRMQPQQTQLQKLITSVHQRVPKRLALAQPIRVVMGGVGELLKDKRTWLLLMLLLAIANGAMLGFQMVSPSMTLNRMKGLSDKEWFENSEKVRGTNFQLLASVLSSLATLSVAWLSISNSQRTTIETLKLTRKSQDSDTYKNATELLSSEQAFKQISGINSLFVLATSDSLYLLLVEQVLAAFLREKAERSASGELFGIDKDKALSYSPYFAQVTSKRANTPEQIALTSLLGIRESRLSVKQQKSLSVASLSDLDLSFLFFKSGYLCNLTFVSSDLRGACFHYSTLVDCYFLKADLRGASFIGANISGGTLAGADISQADFTDTKGLTWKDILKAESTGGTLLPGYLLDSSDIPEFFDRAYYDHYGWGNSLSAISKRLEHYLQKPSNPPATTQLPPLPPLPEA